ncbi:hypothetical protein L1787_08395 [Acuticoccus sp. M5D2P5]|uniref:RraA family protein n=1 Tax=Acuticoccus kalidii TaxID=2910977 RepID=UPI001F451D5B|nr:hypothetical protein [Acuticoccus kalidii]MCF3933427.1 hypothetical protein [Acuticoccus kalidii]
MTDALLSRLAALETGQVSDVLDEVGLFHHAISPSLRPLAPGKFAGRAVCVRGSATAEARHPRRALPGDTLERVVGPNTVLFIESGDFVAGALLGGFVAYSLQRLGCQAIVTDGAIRDADEIRGYGLPLISRAVVPVNGSRRFGLTEANVPVAMPGTDGRVPIAPGDLILGDGDGVIVVPAADAEQLVADSEELARIEGAIGEAMRAGGERPDVFKANPRFAHIRPLGGAK